MVYHSSFKKYDKEKMAKAVGLDLPASTKESIEISNAIRYKSLSRAKAILKDAIALKHAIPYKRFIWDMGHKPGMAAGRFPVKVASLILALLESAEANAQFKGLNSAHLHIVHINANRAARPMRAGRHRGRQAKRTHIELVLQERVKKAKEPALKKIERANNDAKHK